MVYPLNSQRSVWQVCHRAATGLTLALLLAVVALEQVQAQTYTLLYTFTGAPDGARPVGGLILDAKGNLFGTTQIGGSSRVCLFTGCGTVFRLDATGKETVLYSFNNARDGAYPDSALVRGAAGNFYGTTSQGGIPGAGTVFKLSSGGKETVLHNFTGNTDGGFPTAALIRDAAGNLYGTTPYGGSCSSFSYGCGTIFKVDKTGKLKTLYTFSGQADGSFPYPGLIRDALGNLYGAASFGGPSACGTVFKFDTTGKLTVVYSFTGKPDGCQPQNTLIRDAKGNFYGTTAYGGTNNLGTVFRLDPTGKETVLYSFSGIPDGAFPQASLIRDAKGNLYGITNGGGANGYGTVFGLDSTGKETMLYSFSGGNDGKYPTGNLIRDTSGNLYSTTSSGGTYNQGTVFRLTP